MTPLGSPVGREGLDRLPEAVRLSGDPDQPPLVVLDLDDLHGVGASDLAPVLEALGGRTVVTVGVGTRPVPPRLHPLQGALTTSLTPGGADRAWVHGDADAVRRIAANVAGAPLAALTLANLLPALARADVPDGLQLESLAYSTLLAGPEFAAWRARTPRRGTVTAAPTDGSPGEPVLLERVDDTLLLTLNRPSRHNAFGTAVRDGLIAGLELARLDPGITEVRLRGAGRSFCSGGDLDEFGTAVDPASAHLVRIAHSAGLLVHELRDRIGVDLHGACIGAGIEVPSFAGHVTAEADTFFCLPELSMGLIPGAGGTVSITRRVGRWRTAFLALAGDRLDARTALEWGLVDAVT